MPLPAAAGSLTVAPTTIELHAGRDIGVLHLTNESGAPMVAQLEAFDWSQTGGQDKLAQSTALIVSPPMARLAPGAAQIVRLQADGADAPGERSFRLLVTQLPDPAAPKVAGINLLLQFSVPVFLDGAVPAQKANLAFDAVLKKDGLWLSAHNAGSAHVKLTRIALFRGDEKGPSIAGLFYVLSGAERAWKFSPAAIASGQSLRIEATDSSGGPPIVANVVVHSG